MAFDGSGASGNPSNYGPYGAPLLLEDEFLNASDAGNVSKVLSRPEARAEDATAANSTGRRGAASQHKALVPVTGSEIAMFAVAALVLFLAAGAGVGGGPVSQLA